MLLQRHSFRFMGADLLVCELHYVAVEFLCDMLINSRFDVIRRFTVHARAELNRRENIKKNLPSRNSLGLIDSFLFSFWFMFNFRLSPASLARASLSNFV